MKRKIEYTLNFRNRTPIEDDEEYRQLEDFKDAVRAMMKNAGMDVEFGHCQISEVPALRRNGEAKLLSGIRQAITELERGTWGSADVAASNLRHLVDEYGEKEGNHVGRDNDHDVAGSGSPEDHRKRVPRL